MMMLGSGDMPVVVVTVMATYLRSRPIRKLVFERTRGKSLDRCVCNECLPTCVRRHAK